MDKRLLNVRFKKSTASIFVLFIIFIIVFFFHPFNELTTVNLQSYPNLVDSLKGNTVISDIKIKKCFYYSSCQLNKVEQLQWRRLDSPLELYAAKPFRSLLRSMDIFNTFVFVKQALAQTVDSALVDVKITLKGEPINDSNEGWVLTDYDSYTIWKKFISKSHETFEQVDLVRDLDILFGMDDLQDSREYWQYQRTSIPVNAPVLPHLTLLKVPLTSHNKIFTEFHEFQSLKQNEVLLAKSNSLKIVQISDLHIGPDTGFCLDSLIDCTADLKSLEFLESSFEGESSSKPIDLVVITGDLIDSHRTKEFKSSILKSLSPILSKKIPFIFTFGEMDEVPLYEDKPEDENSPDESDLKVDTILKLNILNFISSLPYCYNKFVRYNQNLHGLTNYNMKVFKMPVNEETQLKLDEPAAIITVLDSENHKIDSSQINFLYRENQPLKSKDPFKLLFFHYPLPNYRPQGEFKLIGAYNDKKPLKKKTDMKFRDDIASLGYQVVSVGHEYKNDLCLLSEKIDRNTVINSMWLCYSSGAGASVGTSVDYDRKLRVFQIDFEKKQMLSWKRSALKGAFDHQMIHEY